jgi:hypothetical protein
MSVYYTHEDEADYTVIECDKCTGFKLMVESIDTPTKEIENYAKEDGWSVKGGYHICPECVASQQEKNAQN